MATCRYRRSAVPEVSPWLAQPTRDDGDMPLPPKRGSRSQPVVGPAHPRRRRHAATAEARFRKSARGWPIPPETTATRRYRRSAVPEVSTGLACLPRDNGDMRRYRRRAVVEGACRQVTCCNPNFPYNKTESNEMETPPICICKPAVFKWRWRDSNSRPNVELICFLHA